MGFKFTYMGVNWGDGRTIFVATHHHRLGMICNGEIKKSFAGFHSCVMICWLSESFVEVGAGTTCEITEDTNVIIERRGYTTNAREVHQKTSIGTS